MAFSTIPIKHQGTSHNLPLFATLHTFIDDPILARPSSVRLRMHARPEVLQTLFALEPMDGSVVQLQILVARVVQLAHVTVEHIFVVVDLVYVEQVLLEIVLRLVGERAVLAPDSLVVPLRFLLDLDDRFHRFDLHLAANFGDGCLYHFVHGGRRRSLDHDLGIQFGEDCCLAGFLMQLVVVLMDETAAAVGTLEQRCDRVR